MATSTVATPADEASTPSRWARPPWGAAPPWSERAAAVAFAAYLVVALVWLIVVAGDKHWFVGDDWGMLVERSLSDPVGWFTAQNTHWSTVPTVTYLALFKIFGLHSYVPYMAAVAVAHLVLAVLLRSVMRRVGVGPWVATIVAGSFVLYGTGQQNIVFAIQISMVTSMVCGVGHLLLADHDGGIDRRDAVGLGLGLLAIMASGVGPPMVLMVGIFVLLRRGWRLALIHTVPLGAIYLLWAWWQDPLAQGTGALGRDVGAIGGFVRAAVAGVFEGLGQSVPAAILLAAVLVVGLILAWAPLSWTEWRRQGAAPVAMAVGALAVLAVAGSQRYALGEAFARSSRFVSMATALVLPALAVAVTAIVRRWWVAAPIAVAGLLVGVPGNIAAFTEPAPGAERYRAQQEFLLGALESPFIDDVSRDALPYPGEGIHQVDVGFLVDGRATGKFPDPPPLSDTVRAKIDTRLTLSQSEYGVELPGATCQTSTQPIEITPEVGERFRIGSPVAVARQLDDGTFSPATGYNTAWSGEVLTAQVPDQRYRITPASGAASFVWCTAP